MTGRDHIYDLLCSYDEAEDPLPAFYAVWCQGLDKQEVARRLGADLGSATAATFADCAGITMHAYGDRAIFVGKAGAWIAVIGDRLCASDAALKSISGDGVKVIGMGWSPGGPGSLTYAIDGVIVTQFKITNPNVRLGVVPDALDSYMTGLRFHLGDDQIGDEGPVEVAESITSALTLIGRVTGVEINKRWLDAAHTLYVIPEGEVG
ncbi:DUF6461 domain-containing protein [Streptosporangium carneum]|uniref:Uncharacterized protein n=1 Tax=Streptosporangium carneum TaxID=47481 RepID=A0A9W6MCB9_9ACTN|nr:DUF6461 domain-containing protein [Streptosporangium carneum]GLK08892.1 hypothetical protein GCM10017600_22970 [Streptosporangium carneum]